MRCPHSQNIGVESCRLCIAKSWKHFQRAVSSARERLPEGTIPAMLLCVDMATGECEVVAPEWLKEMRDQTIFLRQVVKQMRSSRVRRIPLE